MTQKRVPELDDQPGYSAWMEVVKTYGRCHRLMSVELERLGVSAAQHEILLAVAREEGIAQNRLAAKLLVTKSNITAMLDRLEKAGWVSRVPNPRDTRSRCVSLTTAGRKLFRRTVKTHAAIVALMTKDLTTRDIETFERTMRTARAHLEAALGEDFAKR